MRTAFEFDVYNQEQVLVEPGIENKNIEFSKSPQP